MEIQFLGAAETVTGSKYLLRIESTHVLVDCGLYQGLKEYRLRNWSSFPFKAKDIDCVLLTHAHIDHSGYLPLLIKNGFQGPIYCTAGTRDLCNVLLPDSGYLQEEEAQTANRHGYSKHHPALPLYTKLDAEKALEYFKPVGYRTKVVLGKELSAQFIPAGHIIGASLVEINYKGSTILFSGDLGRPHDMIMKPPALVKGANYLIVESTYGDRLHDKESPMVKLAEIINRTVARGGSVIIPSFAVGRAQSLIYYICLLKKENKIPNIPVFLDSPMAIKATDIFCSHMQDHRLNRNEIEEFNDVATYVNTIEDSKRIDNFAYPIIIISASGMATGGRVLHHLKLFAPDRRHTILFAGYQAPGTRGDRIVKGEKAVKIHGMMVPIEAEVAQLDNVSAHADYEEILGWLSHFEYSPKKVFITHGDIQAAISLKEKIETKFHWKCIVPEYLQIEKLK
ncbi:MAG: MBL fold metallo-hydrolase RNA specificity domain-containing protein [Candidatus Berkiella sp.]